MPISIFLCKISCLFNNSTSETFIKSLDEHIRFQRVNESSCMETVRQLKLIDDRLSETYKTVDVTGFNEGLVECTHWS